MLGSEVSRFFSQYNYDLSLTYRSLNKKKKLEKILKSNKKINWLKLEILKVKKKELKKMLSSFDVIINCAGIIKPEINENDPNSINKCLYVNSVFPHLLNSQKKKKTRIYQIATDCVFSGVQGKYNENCFHDAEDIYGKSKSIGEVKDYNFYNLRVSIIGKEIFGFKSLISWYLKNKNSNLNGYVDHNWNGVTTLSFARVLNSIIQYKIQLPNSINIIPRNIINKYQLLNYLSIKFNNGKKHIKKFKGDKKIDRSLTSKYQKLQKQIWKNTIFKKQPTIKQMINDI